MNANKNDNHSPASKAILAEAMKHLKSTEIEVDIEQVEHNTY